MWFRDIYGQDKVKNQLLQMVASGRIGHALLFSGGEGTGALPLALALAQYLHCTGEKSTDVCGNCASCYKHSKLVHPDLHFVFPVVKRDSNHSNPISSEVLDPWRSMVLGTPYFSLHKWVNVLGVQKQAMIYSGESQEIIRKLSMKTYEGAYKIMIVWLPEKMNPVASNKLLKILEEPPQGTLFILVSENPAEILPTILSRTQSLKIPGLADETISAQLQKEFDIDGALATSVAKTAMGNYLLARQAVEQQEETRRYFELFKHMMRTSYARKVPDMLVMVDQFYDLSRENQKNFLNYALKMLRENFVMNLQDTTLVYLTAEEQEFSAKFSPFIHEANVFQLNDELNLAIAHIEQNGNSRIIMMDLMLKLTMLLLTPRP